MNIRKSLALIAKQFNKRPYHTQRAYDLMRGGTALADLPENLKITPRCYNQIFYLIVKFRKSKEPDVEWLQKQPYWTSEEEMEIERYSYETLSTSEKFIYDN